MFPDDRRKSSFRVCARGGADAEWWCGVGGTLKSSDTVGCGCGGDLVVSVVLVWVGVEVSPVEGDLDEVRGQKGVAQRTVCDVLWCLLAYRSGERASGMTP